MLNAAMETAAQSIAQIKKKKKKDKEKEKKTPE